MASLFTRIIAGEIPCYKVAENEHCVAFLDINPVQRGHTLVVPKHEVDYIYDLPDDVLTELTLFSKRVAKAIQEEIPCNRIGVTVIGLEVPHAHIHLIPINGLADMDFKKARVEMSQEEYVNLAHRIGERVI